MKLLFLYSFLFLSLDSISQIVSHFNFDSNPVTNALVGPNASSISGSAISDAGGVGGTNGLNAGLPKANINMVIPTDVTFDTEGVDVSFDYHREESSGTFFQRGSSLRINGCANLSVTYRVDDGAGGFTTINSGNVFAIPNDDTFRNYRFFYTTCDGLGVLTVDGNIVWSNDGTDNRSMYWVGSGNITIGGGIDGTGNDDTFFDNLIIAGIGCTALPIELLNFSCEYHDEKSYVQLDWITATERDNDYFTVEKSKNGLDWTELEKVNAVGNSIVKQYYSTIDYQPYSGLSYYRLKQTDFNGEFEYFTAASINRQELEEINIYPNPTTRNSIVVIEYPKIYKGAVTIELYDLSGKRVFLDTVDITENRKAFLPTLNEIESGVYILKTVGFQSKLVVK